MQDSSPAAAPEPIPTIDTTVPHSARFWDYLLGGKDNYPVDREVGDQVLRIDPDLRDAARADRGFLVRAVRYLVGEAGIRQLLDIGTGLPTANNTHQVAQATAPECRIVYVDNDPLVLVHARALLTSTPEGTTEYLNADVRDPERILQAASRTLDFTRPIALMLLGIINYIPDNSPSTCCGRSAAGCVAFGQLSGAVASHRGSTRCSGGSVYATLERKRRSPDQNPQSPGAPPLLRRAGAARTRCCLVFTVAPRA